MSAITKETVQSMAESAYLAYNTVSFPFSNYPIAAAILTQSGEIFNGCKVENATQVILQAELNALGSAATKGHTVFRAVLVMSEKGQELPCASSKDTLAQFNPSMPVYTANPDKTIVKRENLAVLYPQAAFDAHNPTDG